MARIYVALDGKRHNLEMLNVRQCGLVQRLFDAYAAHPGDCQNWEVQDHPYGTPYPHFVWFKEKWLKVTKELEKYFESRHAGVSPGNPAEDAILAEIHFDVWRRLNEAGNGYSGPLPPLPIHDM